MVDLTEKYIEKTDLFMVTNRDYNYVMPCPEVVRVNQLLNLLTAILQKSVEK